MAGGQNNTGTRHPLHGLHPLLRMPYWRQRFHTLLSQGATQACTSEVDEVDLVVWEHPLEVHMQTQSLQVRGRACGGCEGRGKTSVGYSATSRRRGGHSWCRTERALQCPCRTFATGECCRWP